MAKFLVLFHRNPVAPWPTDPEESLKFFDMVWAGVDNLINTGEIVEMGTFLDPDSGYVIGKGDGETMLKNLSMFSPFWEFEVQEIVPYPKSREIFTEILKTQAQLAKK